MDVSSGIGPHPPLYQEEEEDKNNEGPPGSEEDEDTETEEPKSSSSSDSSTPRSCCSSGYLSRASLSPPMIRAACSTPLEEEHEVKKDQNETDKVRLGKKRGVSWVLEDYLIPLPPSSSSQMTPPPPPPPQEGFYGGGDFYESPSSPSCESYLEEYPEMKELFGLVNKLPFPGETREEVLKALGEKVPLYPDLMAPFLWFSEGSVATLMKELVDSYYLYYDLYITKGKEEGERLTVDSAPYLRLFNTMNLVKCLVNHEVTRGLFVKSHLVTLLFPFITTDKVGDVFEHFKILALSVVVDLAKSEEEEVIELLLATEVVPMCLGVVNTPTSDIVAKILALLTIQRIMMSQIGFDFICETYDRYYAVAISLGYVCLQLATFIKGNKGEGDNEERKRIKHYQLRLLKIAISCYLRFVDDARAIQVLKECIPPCFTKDPEFLHFLIMDETNKITKYWVVQMLHFAGLPVHEALRPFEEVPIPNFTEEDLRLDLDIDPNQ